MSQDRVKPPKTTLAKKVEKKPAPDFFTAQKERSLERRTTWYDLHKEELQTLTLRQRAFLKAYTEHLTIRQTCLALGFHSTFHKAAMHNSPTYARLFNTLRDYVVESLEDEGFRRAYHGVKESIYFQGEVCGEKQIYSDSLLMFFLRAANPDKYRERSTMDLNVKPTAADLHPALQNVSRDTLRKIRELVENDNQRNLVIDQEKSA